MLKFRSSNATIALIAFVLMITIVSTSFTTIGFAQVTVPATYTGYQTKNPLYQTGPAGHPLASDPQKRSWYNPLPAWQMYQTYTGPNPAPSPWYAGASSGWARYNVTNSNYNDYSTAPTTAHIRWIYQYGQKFIVTRPEWGYNFRLGPLDQMSDAYSGMMGANGYIITWQSETGGQILTCNDEWNGQVVWQTKLPDTVGDQPFWLMNGAGGPYICCVGGTTVYRFALPTGNLADSRKFPKTPAMYYNSSKFAQLSITETELFAPGGVMYCSDGGYWYCYSWNDPTTKLWGPTLTAGGSPSLIDDVLCYANGQSGTASGIDAITGAILWQNAQTQQSQSTQAGGYGLFYVPTNDGSIRAFDVKTGDLVWHNLNLSASYWNEFFITVGDDKVVCDNRDGNIYCLDAHTGEFLWSHYAGPSPYNPWRDYYGSYGYHHIGVGGGSVAFGTGPGVYTAAVGDESIGTVSAVPGDYEYVLDMETGQLLYKYPGGTFSHNQHGIVLDGLMVVWNPVSSQILCRGKGETKIDIGVTASQIPSGGYTWITGRITDQSPAQPGTPCVSQDSMELWMTYLHGGFPAPGAGLVKGVTVSLVAVDTANNVYDLGNVTSDSMGYFRVKWTPPKEELYQVTASFAEDASYYSTWAVTDLAVGAAGAAASTAGAIVTVNPTMSTLTYAALAIAACAGTVSFAALFKIRRHKGGDKQ